MLSLKCCAQLSYTFKTESILSYCFLILVRNFSLLQVRKRPLNKKEVSRKEEDIIDVHNSQFLTVHEPKLKVLLGCLYTYLCP